jgi:tetratricopeptide (TPR) repeat protein
MSEVLSLHFFHAGSYSKAWHYSRLAGQRARAKYAHNEAVEFFERAVESARRAQSVPPQEVSAAFESLGDARELAGRSAAAIDAFQRARRLSAADPVRAADLWFKEARTQQRLGRISHSLRILSRAMSTLAGLDTPVGHASRSHLATRYAWGRMTQGRYDQAMRWAAVAAREAEDSGDKTTLAHAYNGLHLARHYAGQPEDVPYGRLALMAYEELGDLTGQGHSANNLGVEALDRGRMAEALEFFERAAATFSRLGDEANQANATYNQADVLLQQRRFADAEPLLTAALGIARAVKDEELVALVQRETGRVLVGMGRLDEAEQPLLDARERFTRLGLAQELQAVDAALAECRNRQRDDVVDLTSGTDRQAGVV